MGTGFYTLCIIRGSCALGEVVQSTQSCWTANEQDLNFILKCYSGSSTKDGRGRKA